MKKILFGITSLTLGGAERVLVDIANNLSSKYDVTIFTIYAKGELESQLDKNVKLKSLYDISYLELSKFQKHFIMPLKLLLFNNRIYNKKIKNNYDVEVAFLEGPITRLFSTKNKNTKKIAWIHNDISLVFGKGIKSKIKRNIDKKTYKKYEKLIFVSKDNLKKFVQVYPGLKNEKSVIYNYIDKNKVIEKSNEKQIDEFNNNGINFVTVARLVEQKAIDRLIRVHKRLIDNNLKHNIYVIGDGPLKAKLDEQIKSEKVNATFKLLGKKENPYPYIKNADYFCLLSYFEGYGMVLEEAKILEKQVVITDTAAREAVENYKNSTILANDENAIYEGLKEIILNGQKNNTENKEIYNNTKIIEEIINVLEK
jgi:glycosyltransferase involved in cell wall biosynthesis